MAHLDPQNILLMFARNSTQCAISQTAYASKGLGAALASAIDAVSLNNNRGNRFYNKQDLFTPPLPTRMLNALPGSKICQWWFLSY